MMIDSKRMGNLRPNPRPRRGPRTHPRPPLAKRQHPRHHAREQNLRPTSRDPPRRSAQRVAPASACPPQRLFARELASHGCCLRPAIPICDTGEYWYGRARGCNHRSRRDQIWSSRVASRGLSAGRYPDRRCGVSDYAPAEYHGAGCGVERITHGTAGDALDWAESARYRVPGSET